MSFDRLKTRSLFLQAWLLYTCYESEMAPAPTPPITKSSRAWDEELNEIDEYLETSGTALLPINTLLSGIEELEKTKVPDSELDEGDPVTAKPSTPSHDDLNALLEEVGSDLKFSSPKSKRKQPKLRSVQEEKPVINPDDQQTDADYEESFASQQETAQLRDDFDDMCHKMKELNEKMNLVLKERENLPGVINDIRRDLNGQLTAFSDKLYTILESQNSNAVIENTLATVEEVRQNSTNQLKAAAGYLASEPKASSPLMTKGATLKGKGKFKPIK